MSNSKLVEREIKKKKIITLGTNIPSKDCDWLKVYIIPIVCNNSCEKIMIFLL